MDIQPNINWGLWETLLAVLRAGSYSKAASRLGVDSTTVGRRIKLLEKKMGTKLLLRHDRRLYPTHHCEALLSQLENASEQLRVAEQQSVLEDSGTIWRSLRISAPPFIINNLLVPHIQVLTARHRIRVELLGTSSNISLSRREADIAIRIDDKPRKLKSESAHIESENLGLLCYACYSGQASNKAALPWAGLMENNVRTTGNEAMMELAGAQGLQFLVYHFDTLAEITATGVARSMLPCILADSDERLIRAGEIQLKQPVWMLSHSQDVDIPHIKTAREWIKSLAGQHLAARD